MIRDATEAFGFLAIDKKGYEADDIIATLAKNATEEGAIVTIFSSDKDLMQLVSEDIKMYDPIRNIFIDSDRVREKFGVSPDKVIDVQALIGDKVDNIPGVPGVGVKTASSLISEFKTVENLVEKYETIDKDQIDDIMAGVKPRPPKGWDDKDDDDKKPSNREDVKESGFVDPASSH